MNLYLFLGLITSSFAAFGTEPICSKTNGNAALVIIDMNYYYIEAGRNDLIPANISKVKQLLDQQLAAIKKAREKDIPIIFVQTNRHPETITKLSDATKNYPNVKHFVKDTDSILNPDGLSRKPLAEYIAEKEIGTLIIAGANGGSCVHASIENALKENCSVVALSSVIADFNYKDFIYPYANYYRYDKPNCTNCFFKEVSSLEAAEKFMIKNERRPKKISVESKSAK